MEDSVPDTSHLASSTDSAEYRETMLASGVTALFVLAMAVLTVVAAASGLSTASGLEAWVLRVGAAFAAVAFPIAAVKAALRPWGEPRLRVDAEGIHIMLRGLLSGMVPYVKPRVEHIPWATIQWLDDGPGPFASIVIDYDGFARPKLLSWFGRVHADSEGRIFPLHGFTTPGATIRDHVMASFEEYRQLAPGGGNQLGPRDEDRRGSTGDCALTT
jgi:hypothetical protein